MRVVQFHPAALAEFRNATDWYLKRKKQAARLFVNEVRRVVHQIACQPDRFPFFDANFREAPLIRFPFSILYSDHEEGKAILVIAVAHSSREVGYWLDRA